METISDIWRQLEQALRNAGVFLASRLAAEKFKERHEAGMGSIRFDAGGQVIGCAFLWETGESGLVELGTIWVHDEYRGQGLSKRLFADCCDIIRQKELKAFMITCTDAVANLALRAGWIEDRPGAWKELRDIIAAVTNQSTDYGLTKSSAASEGGNKRLFWSW